MENTQNFKCCSCNYIDDVDEYFVEIISMTAFICVECVDKIKKGERQ